uniref:ATREV3 n=1 Tax=Arundo donax TaxID=35708 RepID=A0A0A9G6J2_ARUDO
MCMDVTLLEQRRCTVIIHLRIFLLRSTYIIHMRFLELRPFYWVALFLIEYSSLMNLIFHIFFIFWLTTTCMEWAMYMSKTSSFVLRCQMIFILSHLLGGRHIQIILK